MRNTTKLAGAAGIIWATTNAIAAFSTGQPPALDASGADIASYLADHRGVYLTAVAIFGATLPLLFVFAGELRHRVRTEVDGVTASVVNHAVAALVIGTTLAYVLLVPFIFGDGLGTEVTDVMLRYAYVLTFLVSMIGNIGGATLIAAASGLQPSGPRAASRVAAGAVGLCCVGGLVSPSLAMLGGLGFVVIAVWTVVVGIAMVREHATVPQTTFATA